MNKSRKPIPFFHFFVVFIFSAFLIATGSLAVIKEYYHHSSKYGDFILQGEKAVMHGWGIISIGLGLMITVIGNRTHPEANKFFAFVMVSTFVAGFILMAISSPIGR